MYAGAVVEEGPVDRIFEHPSHPYTRALLRATHLPVQARKRPSPDSRSNSASDRSARGLPVRRPVCVAIASCRRPPPLVEIEPDHTVLCVRAGEAEVAA